MKLRSIVHSVLLGFFGFFILPVSAAPGDLDATFSGVGWRTIGPEVSIDQGRGNAIVIQPDGRILTAGFLADSFGANFGVARLLPDGTLDSSFGGDGIVTTDVSADADVVSDIALQPDGKIICVGYSERASDLTYNVAIARYNSDGTLDATFGNGGLSSVRFTPTGSNFANAVVIQSDGKIVVAGSGNGDFGIMRLNSNGTFDTSFDIDGRVTTSINGLFEAIDLAIEPGGKLVLAGYATNSSGGSDFAVARYLTNGSLDAAFDSDGIQTIDLSGSISFREVAFRLVIQPDGKFVLGGYTRGVDTGRDFGLVRLNSNGSLDNTFDFDGRLNTPVTLANDNFSGLKLLPNGKYLATGYTSTTDTGPADGLFVLYNPNGSLDGGFDTDGIRTFSLGGRETFHALELDSSGRPVIAGRFGVSYFVGRFAAFAVPTAANATISGRVLSKDGHFLSRTMVRLSGMDGQVRSVKTSSFGYFRFDDVPVGEVYFLEANAKGFQPPEPLVITLLDSVFDLEIIMSPD